jgi:hypothetical protein
MQKQLLTVLTTLLFVTTIHAQNFRKMQECVIENGTLKTVIVDYDPATGDKSIVVNGVRSSFQSLYPSNGKDYASAAKWYINNDVLKIKGRGYAKYGLPRILGVTEITKSGLYEGVGVYVEAGITGEPEVIYIPVRQGCEFQPYQYVKPECGTVVIKPSVKEVKTGKDVSFTATVNGAKGTLSYSWSSLYTIKGDKYAKKVTISAKDVKAGSKINASLYITGTGCASYASAEVKVIP